MEGNKKKEKRQVNLQVCDFGELSRSRHITSLDKENMVSNSSNGIFGGNEILGECAPSSNSNATTVIEAPKASRMDR